MKLAIQNGEPRAFFVRPGGETVVGMGPFVARSEPPSDGVAFFRNDFPLGENQPWLVPECWESGPVNGFAGMFAGLAPARWNWTLPEAGRFSEVFHEVTEAIRSGMFEKTVPVAVERGQLESGEARATAAAFLRSDPFCYGYGMVDGGSGFAGTTPEWLVTVDGRTLSTMALAGTARSEDVEVFEADEKEVREHEFVVQALVEKLAGLGTVRRGNRRILDLGPLIHFHTPIEVDLEADADVSELVRRLHPTPALGPLPRTRETMAMLGEWRRRLGCPPGFGAPFGLWQEGRFEAVVAIRGVWWEGEEILLPSGCGVIEASRLVNEWRELRLKREAVKRRME
jgi:menaquinone-specific isochorismate synthase